VNVARFRQGIQGPELELECVLISSLEEILEPAHARWWVGASVPVGASRPDFLVAAYRPQVQVLAGAARTEIEILSYLHGVRWARQSTVSARLRRPERDIARGLCTLYDSGVVEKTKSAFSLRDAWRDILPEIVTVEVKVANWKRAIQQAILNRVFSHRVYIALPAKIATKVAGYSLLAEFGIGVLALAEGSGVSILRRAPVTGPMVMSYYYRIASIVADDLGGETCSLSYL